MTDDSSRIEDRAIPTELGGKLRTAFGLERAPATLGEWVDATADLAATADIDLGYGAMCTADESRHVAVVDGGRQHFHCVLDTFLLPSVVEGQSRFAVRSESPASDAVVELVVTDEGVEAAPTDAVVSLGVADDVAIPDEDELDPALAYDRLCPYINAFPDDTEYERWARGTPEATTMALSPAAGFELAQLFTRSHAFVTG